MMPAYEKAFVLRGEDIVEYSTENDFLRKGSCNKK